jgi:hypothetical protein
MHVRAAFEPANLGIISSTVVIVADMAGLMKILDAVDQKAKGEPPFLDRLALVPNDFAKFVDPVYDAAVL